MSYSPLFRGNSSQAPSVSTASGYQNGTGSTMAVATAVSAVAANPGQMALTDVTLEASAEGWLGLTSESTPSTAIGQVSGDGRLQNIPAGLGFSVGDPIWVGNTPGSLTNVRPDLTVSGWVSGMYILFVGVVVQNEFDNTKQDIQLSRQIIGQL